MRPPVEVGDEVDVQIDAVGEKGDGIAKVQGFVLFVPGVKQGQTVKVKITKVLRRVGFAEVVGKSEGAEPEAEEAEKEPEGSEEFGEEEKEESEEDLEGLKAPKSEEEEEPQEEEPKEEEPKEETE